LRAIAYCILREAILYRPISFPPVVIPGRDNVASPQSMTTGRCIARGRFMAE
jgi:hypothetical protein